MFCYHYKKSFLIEVINKESNITARCEGSFLSGITPEYRYTLHCDLSGTILSCYINGEEKDILKSSSLAKDFNISDKKLPFNKENNFKVNQKQRVKNGNIN